MLNPNKPSARTNSEDKNTDASDARTLYKERAGKVIVIHRDMVNNSKSESHPNKPKSRPNSSPDKIQDEPVTYASIKPFHFPPKEEYRIISRFKEMEKTGKFIPPYEASIRNQAAADKRIEYYTSKLAKLMPNPSIFRKDAGRDQRRIDYCTSLQSKISARHASANYGQADNDEKMDFAFEGLLYKFVENGLFENNNRKAKMIFTSNFDDYVNADSKEEAHATDCAFLVPVEYKDKDNKDILSYIPIAIAATTSASKYPPKNSRTGQNIIQEKLSKYPKNQAFVEFAVNEDGSHRNAEFMPVFVLGFQHDKVREILTTYNNLDECLTKEIKHNFNVQIIMQCISRINSLRRSSKKDDAQTQIAISKYRALYKSFDAEDEKICKGLNRKSRDSIWNDNSAQLVVDSIEH